ncbi:transglycosylase SLT domain-containing protein [Streptomyces sp. NBC_01387]|uniref:transglycosylase SLT domain-containing protein n=1 Tax=unclassified Streptomyces TaxID=2593676 RepID=UPI002025AF27|nr:MULTISPECIES: transglycosylase SLT domain-containing protein [unclassified Streptomyces]MCX4553267.1 transglycosylase SLT domain-containing protein [Streptomyces sp. NBC_01500]
MTATTRRILNFRKTSVVGIAAVGAAACALTLAPHPAQAAEPAQAAPASVSTVIAAQVAQQADHAEKAAQHTAAAKKAPSAKHADAVAEIVKSTKYSNNLDGWIRESLAIMKVKHIPGSYEGLHRNIMRESSGDPHAQNNWDINARNGIPSKGLLQVIQPTFDTYHVKGTKDSLTDPVANIVAAANYAADRYGSMDNVNSAY